jgi:hypothetical protein
MLLVKVATIVSSKRLLQRQTKEGICRHHAIVREEVTLLVRPPEARV